MVTKMLIISSIIGITIGYLCVFITVFIYRFKGHPNAGIIRILGVSLGAIVSSFGLYLLRHVFGDGTSPDVDVSITFSVSTILSLIFFFWLNRRRIG